MWLLARFWNYVAENKNGNTKSQIDKKKYNLKKFLLAHFMRLVSFSYSSGLGVTRGRQPAPTLSPAQTKKKEACVGDEQPALI